MRDDVRRRVADPSMGVTPELFREVMGRLGGGVTVVTSTDPTGEPRGLTATAVCSVSLDPPLVLACIGSDSLTGEAVRASGRYALNLLSSDGRSLSELFASTSLEKFEHVAWIEGSNGCPLLAGCLASAECSVESALDAGDHTIFVGRVTAGSVEAPAGDPLVYFRGAYRSLGDEAAP